MIFLIIGALMIVLKIMEVGFLADLSWWYCMIPFGLTFLYWEIYEVIFKSDIKRQLKKQKRLEAERKQQKIKDLYDVKIADLRSMSTKGNPASDMSKKKK